MNGYASRKKECKKEDSLQRMECSLKRIETLLECLLQMQREEKTEKIKNKYGIIESH